MRMSVLVSWVKNGPSITWCGDGGTSKMGIVAHKRKGVSHLMWTYALTLSQKKCSSETLIFLQRD